MAAGSVAGRRRVVAKAERMASAQFLANALEEALAETDCELLTMRYGMKLPAEDVFPPLLECRDLMAVKHGALFSRKCWNNTVLDFDAVPRPVIAEALAKVQLSPQLQSLLLAWHIDTAYHLDVNQTARSVPVTRGVRQGCSSAPLLWTTVMVLLLDSLQHTVPLQWIQNNITIYADDIHVFLHF